MKKSIVCDRCNSDVEKEAIALYKKIVNAKSKKFLCMDCLSNYLDTSIEDLLDKIEEFKKEGCKLFH